MSLMYKIFSKPASEIDAGFLYVFVVGGLVKIGKKNILVLSSLVRKKALQDLKV